MNTYKKSHDVVCTAYFWRITIRVPKAVLWIWTTSYFCYDQVIRVWWVLDVPILDVPYGKSTLKVDLMIPCWYHMEKIYWYICTQHTHKKQTNKKSKRKKTGKQISTRITTTTTTRTTTMAAANFTFYTVLRILSFDVLKEKKNFSGSGLVRKCLLKDWSNSNPTIQYHMCPGQLRRVPSTNMPCYDSTSKWRANGFCRPWTMAIYSTSHKQPLDRDVNGASVARRW